MSTHGKISRRTWLKGMAGFSAAAGVPLVFASTPDPNGNRTCQICKFFISGGGGRSGMTGDGMMGHGMMGVGACQVVEGRISSMGYCDLYIPA
jgi:hypothetical protein